MELFWCISLVYPKKYVCSSGLANIVSRRSFLQDTKYHVYCQSNKNKILSLLKYSKQLFSIIALVIFQVTLISILQTPSIPVLAQTANNDTFNGQCGQVIPMDVLANDTGMNEITGEIRISLFQDAGELQIASDILHSLLILILQVL
jgi:hypothetical protein